MIFKDDRDKICFKVIDERKEKKRPHIGSPTSTVLGTKLCTHQQVISLAYLIRSTFCEHFFINIMISQFLLKCTD